MGPMAGRPRGIIAENWSETGKRCRKAAPAIIVAMDSNSARSHSLSLYLASYTAHYNVGATHERACRSTTNSDRLSSRIIAAGKVWRTARTALTVTEIKRRAIALGDINACVLTRKHPRSRASSIPLGFVCSFFFFLLIRPEA